MKTKTFFILPQLWNKQNSPAELISWRCLLVASPRLHNPKPTWQLNGRRLRPAWFPLNLIHRVKVSHCNHKERPGGSILRPLAQPVDPTVHSARRDSQNKPTQCEGKPLHSETPSKSFSPVWAQNPQNMKYMSHTTLLCPCSVLKKSVKLKENQSKQKLTDSRDKILMNEPEDSDTSASFWGLKQLRDTLSILKTFIHFWS